MPIESIPDCLNSDDSLSDEVFAFLLAYQEEDVLVDFKETFDGTDREWLEITKDVMALANTHGGYLVFGVRDGTFTRVGVSLDTRALLTNTNNVLQKLNRVVEPALIRLRAKAFESAGVTFVAWHVPESIDKTHFISRDGQFTHPKGRPQIVLREGTFWVRRSAGNHLGDSSDLEDIFTRRNQRFREALLSKLARVVNAPTESEVFVVQPGSTNPEGQQFTIADSSDALVVKGLSFTVPPSTDQQEVAGWIAMSRRDPEACPPKSKLWSWYTIRDRLELSEDQRVALAGFCLVSRVPAFYWLEGAHAESIKQILRNLVSRQPVGEHVGRVVGTESYRVSRRAHSLRGWSPWQDRGSIQLRYESGPFGWSASMVPSIRRSGPRSRRSRASSGAPVRRCGIGCARPNAIRASAAA